MIMFVSFKEEIIFDTLRWPNSFQVLMPNSPLLLNYLCFGASFFARVKVKNRSFYSSILARVRAVAMTTEFVKIKANKMAFVYLNKNSVVRFFSSFAHYEITLNPFCLHCSDKLLT